MFHKAKEAFAKLFKFQSQTGTRMRSEKCSLRKIEKTQERGRSKGFSLSNV